MSDMNILDIIVLLLIAGAALNGLRRGFVRQVARLVGFVLALVIAFRFSPDLAAWLRERIPLSEETGTGFWMSLFSVDTLLFRIVAFVLLFFGVSRACCTGSSNYQCSIQLTDWPEGFWLFYK